jgi:hypothetical protein
MKVLIGCEESQSVCLAFRALGHEAYSCDLKPCSGGHPEWHFKQSIFEVAEQGWDLLIAHPPCTYLTVTGNSWFNFERYGQKAIDRWSDRFDASMFFIKLWNLNIDKICLENPIGFISNIIKPSQIIQPYYFGDEAQKTTCLWLKGLPLLKHYSEPDLFTEKTHVDRGEMVTWINKQGKKKSMPKWYSDAFKLPAYQRAELRSKTFSGISVAMAEQWGLNQPTK